jgi:hypothetical protein
MLFSGALGFIKQYVDFCEKFSPLTILVCFDGQSNFLINADSIYNIDVTPCLTAHKAQHGGEAFIHLFSTMYHSHKFVTGESIPAIPKLTVCHNIKLKVYRCNSHFLVRFIPYITALSSCFYTQDHICICTAYILAG